MSPEYLASLTVRQRKILDEFYERGDRANNADYRYGWDEGEGGARGIIGH